MAGSVGTRSWCTDDATLLGPLDPAAMLGLALMDATVGPDEGSL